MTPTEMLDVIDAALARSKGRRRKRREPVLLLTVPRVFGVTGREMPTEAQEPPTYGYTARQCRAIRRVIEQAAYADLATMGAR